MYQIELICVTGQHGRTVVLLNAFTLNKYIWNKSDSKFKDFAAELIHMLFQICTRNQSTCGEKLEV